MEKPKFLILDEPMNGLDRQGVIDIHALLKKLREEEKLTLLLTSHHPEDIEALCGKVYIMDNGILSEE